MPEDFQGVGHARNQEAGVYQVELLRIEPVVFEIFNFERAVLGDAPAELVKNAKCRETEVQIGLDGT